MKRFHYIDTLRCLASCAVLLQHLLEHVDEPFFGTFLGFGPGVYGVVLFFYLSGLSAPLSVRNRPPLRWFLLRRVFRIFPAYYAALVLIALTASLGSSGAKEVWEQQTVRSLVANLTLVQDWLRLPALLGVSWTLSLEFIWYGMFAIAAYSMERRAALLANLYCVALLGGALLSLWLERRLPLGRVAMVGAAWMGYLTARWQSGALPSGRYAGSFALFLLAVGATQWVSFGHFQHPSTPLRSGLIAWSFATLTFLAFAVPSQVRESRVTRLRPVLFLGSISYSIYLVHLLAIEVCDRTMPLYAELLGVPLLTVLLAWGMFTWIEKPGVDAGRRLERALDARTARSESIV